MLTTLTGPSAGDRTTMGTARSSRIASRLPAATSRSRQPTWRPGGSMALLQGLADLGSWRSGEMEGDPCARVQAGRSDGASRRGRWSGGTRQHERRSQRTTGQERPDSASKIATAAISVSAILRRNGKFLAPTLRWRPATRSLSAGWWSPAGGWSATSGPHAPRSGTPTHRPTTSFPGQAVPAEEPHPSHFEAMARARVLAAQAGQDQPVDRGQAGR